MNTEFDSNEYPYQSGSSLTHKAVTVVPTIREPRK
jgi:hypothetical protein